MREGKYCNIAPILLQPVKKITVFLKSGVWFYNSWENRLWLCKSFSMIILFLRRFKQFYLLLNIMKY